MLKVVGLSGKIGCGKSTLANMLVEMFPVGMAVKTAYGDLLKHEAARAIGFPVEWCYDQTKKANMHVACAHFPGTPRKVMSVRELLQWYGTDYRRKQDPEYWTNAMRKYLRKMANVTEYIIIDDVRFPNEAELVREFGGLLYRIEPHDRWQPGPHAGHASETALDDYPHWTGKLRPAFGGLDALAYDVFDNIMLED